MSDATLTQIRQNQMLIAATLRGLRQRPHKVRVDEVEAVRDLQLAHMREHGALLVHKMKRLRALEFAGKMGDVEWAPIVRMEWDNREGVGKLAATAPGLLVLEEWDAMVKEGKEEAADGEGGKAGAEKEKGEKKGEGEGKKGESAAGKGEGKGKGKGRA
ncbi:hypothetical protein EDC01DRAFT_630569 [Geopyxis carbonaria]|nr:hypothetical protein EDC01DRAFT_630569 [Geopyxis carbonaria]